ADSLTATSGGVTLTNTTTGATSVTVIQNNSITDVSKITAPTLNLTSTTGTIGTSVASPLTVTSANVSANTSAAGQGIFLNTAGSLNISGNSQAGTAGSGGTFSIVAANNITNTGGTITGNNDFLTATSGGVTLTNTTSGATSVTVIQNNS